MFFMLCIIGLCSAYPFPLEWQTFKKKYHKVYENEKEDYYRMSIFLRNKRKIDQHNSLFEKGEATYKQEINNFGDLSTPVFRNLKNGIVEVQNIFSEYLFIPQNKTYPDSFDWRKKGAVTPVKDQRNCSACWAFSSTGALEAQHFLQTQNLVSFSEQNLIDCTDKFGNFGCNGGFMNMAFCYFKIYNLTSEQSYPYEAKNNLCRHKVLEKRYTELCSIDIITGNEYVLKTAVVTIGPISAAVDASHSSFQFYSSGIYFEPNCNSSQPDHGVLIVGYGTENGQDYWIVKNSWGTSWGEKGYIRISRNRNNHCGIASMASYPDINFYDNDDD